MNCLDDIREKRLKFLDGLRANSDDITLDLFQDLYPDKAHFLYELLQNAEDAAASKVRFVLYEDRLLFEHNGKPFDCEDVRKITGIGYGTKREEPDKIGNFGIGFKAVFGYTKTPRVWSLDFSFEISDWIVPSELDNDPSIGDITRFELPFNSSEKPMREAFSEICNGLREMSADTLLFLSHIESIRWQLAETQEICLWRIEHPNSRIELCTRSDDRKHSTQFLRFTDPVESFPKNYVAVAFLLEPLPNPTKQFRIVPAAPGRVAVYFNASSEKSGLRFHLHAPFVPDVTRASVKDTPANYPLFPQLAALAARSLRSIRDFELLDRNFLAVLPNPGDELSARYRCIREAIVLAMNDQPLTPTHDGSHAPARHLLQAPTALKGLLDSSDDLRVVVDSDGLRSAWAVAATQRNSNVDRFLGGLDIKTWDVRQFVQILDRRLDERRVAWVRNVAMRIGADKVLVEWLRSKSAEWHQRLYGLLNRELEDSDDIDRLKERRIVRLTSHGYDKGSACYFPTDDTREDSGLRLVDEGTYTSGDRTSEKSNAKKLLIALGVREVTERDRVESILKRRYSTQSAGPDWVTYKSDLRRFIALVTNDKLAASVFRGYRIVLRDDDTWARPREVYLDTPYSRTGLHSFFGPLRALGHRTSRVALSGRYSNLDAGNSVLRAFAAAVGASTTLTVEIKHRSTMCHPNASVLRGSYRPGVRMTNTLIDVDWTITGLDILLQNPTEELSRLVWNTMIQTNDRCLRARFRPNQRHRIREEWSTLVLTLSSSSWIPQTCEAKSPEGSNEDVVGLRFVRPAVACQELLPRGFTFDGHWPWLDAVGFGESRRTEQRRKEEDDRKKQKPGNEEADLRMQAMNALEIPDDDESAFEDAKTFVKLPKHKRSEILSKDVDLPESEPKDVTRRGGYVRAQARDAPKPTIKVVSRREDVNLVSVKEERTKPYLRDQYTNEDGRMICQVCKQTLPFKRPNGEYYFEMVRFLRGFERHHYQNYLALCPNHAAMYMHANGSTDQMTEKFRGWEEGDFRVLLAEEDCIIYFTKTHRFDLKHVLMVEGEERG